MKMDRLYMIRREDTTPFTEGHCDICNQSQVKVKPLRCVRHSYCRMCQEFVPRLVRGDFSCTKCSVRYQQQGAESLETVEKFLAEQTETIWPGDCESASQGGTCRELMERMDEVEDDDSDLEGGNAEWDHLLQSICEEEEEVVKSGGAANEIRGRMYSPPRQEVSCKTFSPIPRKTSFLRLGLSSANSGCDDENQPSTSKQPIAISNTVTELLNPPKYAALPAYIPAHAVHRNSSSESDSSSRSSESCHEVYADHSIEISKNSSSSDSFLTDPDEQERGTSPCKLRRPSHKFELCTKDRRKIHGKKEDSEYDLTREIGRIEGPVSDSSDNDVSEEVLSNEKDSFWDI